MSLIKKELPLQAPNTAGDQFQKKLQAFYDKSSADFEALLTLQTEMARLFGSIVEFFAEDPKKATPDEFFVNFSTFLTKLA
ncbi:hypothetical protein SARC_15894, partial [Sphaeroforma arctica JP610]